MVLNKMSSIAYNLFYFKNIQKSLKVIEIYNIRYSNGLLKIVNNGNK